MCYQHSCTNLTSYLKQNIYFNELRNPGFQQQSNKFCSFWNVLHQLKETRQSTYKKLTQSVSVHVFTLKYFVTRQQVINKSISYFSETNHEKEPPPRQFVQAFSTLKTISQLYQQRASLHLHIRKLQSFTLDNMLLIKATCFFSGLLNFN